MISLDNVNKRIEHLGGDKIDLPMLEILKADILDKLKWACYRESFPYSAESAIENLIAIKGVLNKLDASDLIKEPSKEKNIKSVSIENTKVDFEEDDTRSRLKGYRNKLNDLYNSEIEIFCSRYRCLKW